MYVVLYTTMLMSLQKLQAIQKLREDQAAGVKLQNNQVRYTLHSNNIFHAWFSPALIQLNNVLVAGAKITNLINIQDNFLLFVSIIAEIRMEFWG